MALRILPDREYVRSILDYDPQTGIFHWRERPVSHFKNTRASIAWNGKWAGKAAGGMSQGYLLISINKIRFKAHRVAWLLTYGEPVPPVLDHIDGAPSNNRIANLRAASQSENLANARMRTDNHSGVKGVFKKTNGRYLTNIRHDGKTRNIGTFDTLEEAAKAYQEAAIRLYGEFARWG